MSLLPPSGKPNWAGHLDWGSLIEGRTKSVVMHLLPIPNEVAYFEMSPRMKVCFMGVKNVASS